MKKNVNKNEKTFQQFQQFPIKKNVNKKVKPLIIYWKMLTKMYYDFLQRKH